MKHPLNPNLFLAASLIAALGSASCSDGDEALLKGAGLSANFHFTELAFRADDFKKDEGVEQNSPRPAGIAAANDKLYVAIGNLTVDCFSAAGPGYLAVIEATESASEAGTSYRTIELPEACRNPTAVLATESRLYVTCSGAFGYGASPTESLVVLDAATERVLGATRFPACSGGDADCRTAVPGRMALHGDRLLIADSNAGRLLVTDLDGAVDPNFEAGIELCAPLCYVEGDPSSCYQMASDVLATAEGVFATCFNTSEVASLDGDLKLGGLHATGSGAYALAAFGSELLVADTMSNALYALSISESGLSPIAGSDALGKAANQALVRGDRAYVIASTDNAVQVIDLQKERKSDADGLPSTARTVAQIPTATTTSPDATNTSPAFGVLAGDALFVTLTGQCSLDGHEAGNRLLKIDLSAQ